MKHSVLTLASACALAVSALGASSDSVVIATSFDKNPLTNGWKVYGNSELFVWDSANQALNVTWDSSNPNSYFYFPLRTVLTRHDSFSMQFDWTLTDVSGSFEVSLGFINIASATGPNFLRGTGSDSPNLVEFSYLPPNVFEMWDGYLMPTVAATNNWNTSYNSPISSGYAPINLPVNTPMRVVFDYSGTSSTVHCQVTSGATSILSTSFTLDAGFSDFRCDAFAVDCYSDRNGYGLPVLAHGVITNITLTVPPAPVDGIKAIVSNGQWTVQFNSQTNWIYTLERSSDLTNWTATTSTLSGTGAACELRDVNPPAGAQFYRVNAHRPD
jgi:hypothetical protein